MGVESSRTMKSLIMILMVSAWPLVCHLSSLVNTNTEVLGSFSWAPVSHLL